MDEPHVPQGDHSNHHGSYGEEDDEGKGGQHSMRHDDFAPPFEFCQYLGVVIWIEVSWSDWGGILPAETLGGHYRCCYPVRRRWDIDTGGGFRRLSPRLKRAATRLKFMMEGVFVF